MIKKVLIAEDHQSSNLSVQKTLADLGINQSTYTYYCDDAFLQAKNALAANNPFDLLITDLSFEEDERTQELNSGAELIKAIKILQPNIKVLVFSSESKMAVIDLLFKDLHINGYVRKARRDVDELKNALLAIQKNKNYISQALRQTIKENNTYEFSDYDVALITLLAKGALQKDIPNYLEQLNLKPAGLSSIEKRLNLIKESLGFTKNEQLIAFCKDMGVI
jgi:DNA-binding NarL/FixJ family response regulator